jgi:hypothetical protein
MPVGGSKTRQIRLQCNLGKNVCTVHPAPQEKITFNLMKPKHAIMHALLSRAARNTPVGQHVMGETWVTCNSWNGHMQLLDDARDEPWK